MDQSQKLTPDDIERYARHIVLPEIGGPGQLKLKQARVLVIGAGGLGAPLLLYLAAAGCGHLGLVDDDTVSLSNLQRQIIHRTEDVGLPKTDSAARSLKALNPGLDVITHAVRATRETLPALLADYDVVADGSDNFLTRYAVADACLAAKKPLVTAALGRFDGTLTTIKGYERNDKGEWNPTYRCLFPEPPPEGSVPHCAEAGVLGALAGVMGSLMALEVIRAIVPFGDDLVGRLLMVDAMSMRFDSIHYGRVMPPPA
jgi:molybdopterin/thiamine biosynthesis adenylyltransferase